MKWPPDLELIRNMALIGTKLTYGDNLSGKFFAVILLYKILQKFSLIEIH